MAIRIPLALFCGVSAWMLAVVMTVYDGALSVILQPIIGTIVTIAAIGLLLILGSPLMIPRIWRIWHRLWMIPLGITIAGVSAMALSWQPEPRLTEIHPESGEQAGAFQPALAVGGWLAMLFGIVFQPRLSIFPSRTDERNNTLREGSLTTRLLSEPPRLVEYKHRLNASPCWALLEGSMHLEKRSQVFATLDRITKHLDQLGVPYALFGSLAMFLHGYRRFTEDVNLLVTQDGLTTIQARLPVLGYVRASDASRNLHDMESGVKINFHVQGEFPGDGKPKPVAFPDPSTSSHEIDGVRCMTLEKLIELKLASGLPAIHRQRDLDDVQELIHALGIGEDFGASLDPSVREAYYERWRDAQATLKDE